jgi:hypothetical protein
VTVCVCVCVCSVTRWEVGLLIRRCEHRVSISQFELMNAAFYIHVFTLQYTTYIHAAEDDQDVRRSGKLMSVSEEDLLEDTRSKFAVRHVKSVSAYACM